VIHPKALVDDESVIGEGTDVWAFAHIMKGVKIGDRCSFGDHAFVESGAVIGNCVTVKNQVLIWDGVVIEDDVFVGPRVTFTNDRFPRSPRGHSAAERYESTDSWLVQTKVGKGASIGACVTICPGLELGRHCMIAAGSVVTKNVANYALMMGSPARRVQDVCSCGKKLSGPYTHTTCLNCGETPSDRSKSG
jgi:acetyltransferase-like isoleucine patch superfamily enzyme